MNADVVARKIMKECPALRARQVSRMLSRIYDEALRPSGVQMAQLSVLVAGAMFGARGASIGELAGVLVMDRTTLTRNLKPLEKAGLVRVAPSPDDARARVVLLTPAGERLLVAAHPLWEIAQARVRKVLGADRMAALRLQLSDVLSLSDALGTEE
jgi:DNA-binding MarR family transcriptional regulator